MAETGEFALIARHFAPLAAGEAGALGLLDDAAVLDLPPGRALVVTADMMVEGVHFLSDDPPESIGRKLLAVNLSDLAAMGARPRACVLAIALPAVWTAAQRDIFLAGLASGLAAMQAEFGAVLVGGDTVSTPGPLTLSLTAFGTASPAGVLRRSGAAPGDTVWVSGTIGDAALGLKVLTGAFPGLAPAHAGALVERYRRPSPRVALGRALVGRASACADISDGLVADLGHICSASGVVATIEAARVPLSAAGAAAVRADPALLSAVVCGGDDYELVFTASPDQDAAIAAAADAAGIGVTAIGRIALRAEASVAAVRVVDAAGSAVELPVAGWQHF